MHTSPCPQRCLMHARRAGDLGGIPWCLYHLRITKRANQLTSLLMSRVQLRNSFKPATLVVGSWRLSTFSFIFLPIILQYLIENENINNRIVFKKSLIFTLKPTNSHKIFFWKNMKCFRNLSNLWRNLTESQRYFGILKAGGKLLCRFLQKFWVFTNSCVKQY